MVPRRRFQDFKRSVVNKLRVTPGTKSFPSYIDIPAANVANFLFINYVRLRGRMPLSQKFSANNRFCLDRSAPVQSRSRPHPWGWSSLKVRIGPFWTGANLVRTGPSELFRGICVLDVKRVYPVYTKDRSMCTLKVKASF